MLEPLAACQERGRDSPRNFLGIHEHALDPFQEIVTEQKYTLDLPQLQDSCLHFQNH